MKVLDTSSVIAFYDELADPALLLAWTSIGHELCLPRQVFNEIGNCDRTHKLVNPDIANGKIRILDLIDGLTLSALSKRYPYLGQGEISVIATGIHLMGSARYFCVLDDRKARDVAMKLNLPVVGTVGLLDKLVDKGHLDVSRRNECLRQLRSCGFRLGQEIRDR